MITETEIRSQLLEYIRSELLSNPTYPIDDDTSLITGGLVDSFALAQISVFVEEAFGVYLPDIELTARNMNTVADMVACIARNRTPP